MKNIRHQETSRDSLYRDIEQNLETIFQFWANGDKTLRFSVAILCAVKLEAFMNIAGKLKMEHWDILERKLSFTEKCKLIFSSVELVFDPHAEPNKTAINVIEIRNAIVHPKMKLGHVDEYVSQDEYERRSEGYPGVLHHLRSELTKEKVAQIKKSTDAFISQWDAKLLDQNPSYWLNSGSTGGFTFEPPKR
jgi:hypothetical protein